MNDYAWLIYLFVFLVVIFLVAYFVTRPKRMLQKYESGEIRKKFFIKNGIKVGTEKVFFRSGKLNKVKEYQNGQLNGVVVTLYESGAKYIEANYHNGARVGNCTIFEEDGSVKEIKQY